MSTLFWVKIPGYPDYLISASGLIKSIERTVPAKGGSFRTKKAKILSQYLFQGKRTVGIYKRGSKKQIPLDVARLMIISFTKRDLSNQNVTLKDKRRKASLDNLNVERRGKFSATQVKRIRRLLKEGWKVSEIARSYNVRYSIIYNIKEGLTYKWV